MIKDYIKNKIVYLIENRTKPLSEKIGKLENYTKRLDANLGRIDRMHIMDYAFEFVAKSDLNGSYYEFGCFNGSSFIMAYRAYQYWLDIAKEKHWKLTPHMMYAFDSFNGLPELQESDKQSDYHIFDKGQYACSEKDFRDNIANAGIDMDMVTTIPGYYSESLNSNLKKTLMDSKAMIVHIDCDLYSSACSVLNFVTDLLQDGTLLLFDDFYCYKGNPKFGVQRAFIEWCEKCNIKVTSYINYHWAGMAFIINKY